MTRFLASAAAAVCGGTLVGADVPVVRPWRCDSREVGAGDGFVAIRGANTDGHLYIKQAAERGASVVLAERSGLKEAGIFTGNLPNVTFIVTECSAEESLALIASEYLRRVSPKTLAITGSVGKTTTRELMSAALAQSLKVHSAIRSFNTIIGCALTVLSMAEDTEALVLELGTNHFGEISEMVKFFPPEIAVITEVAPAHLEGFGSIEGVLRAKLEICESTKLKEIIYNYDNLLLRDAMSYNYNNIIKTGVGYASGADILIESCCLELNDDGPRTSVTCCDGAAKFSMSSPLFGKQHAYNMCYAYAAAKSCRVSTHETARALAAMRELSGRGLCLRTKRGGWVIDESYNANPASTRAAIDNVRDAAKRHELPMCASLGGMRELGESSPEWHRMILAELEDFDSVLLLGDEWLCSAQLPPNARLCSSLDEMKSLAAAECEKGGVLLVKGSNSYRLKEVVDALSAR